jgi:branched-chain amino acid aminotransferase
MALNVKILAMEISYTTEELIGYTIDILKKENFRRDTYVRPMAYYKSESILDKLNSDDYGFFIFTFPMDAILNIDQGLNVGVSSWTRVTDNMIAPRGKIAGSYVNICLVNYEAKKNGYDDGIILTQDGHVAEGGGQNVAIIKKGKLIIPPVSDDILEGITLDSVITIARDEIGMDTERRRIDRTELYQCEEIFYCGTGCQIAPIVTVDKRIVGDGTPGKKTKQLQSIFFDIVRGKNAKYEKWCTPVE